ncbi:MAG: hypothetical protein WC707_04815 [Candidatus Babeliaceae bacterium]|jgi:hypothetical protein
MKISILSKIILIVSLASAHVSHSMNMTQSISRLSDPLIESAVSFATTGAQNLTNLALTNSPAAVNFGIYQIINKFNKPAIIIFGTEAAVLLTLSCSQGDPLACLSSLMTLDTLHAATQIAVENVGTGATYALGEEFARKIITLGHGTASRHLVHTSLSTLAGAGMGFYAWSMDPSLGQSMLLSACSAIVLTSLTAASTQPALKNIQDKLMGSLNKVSTGLGKVIGVATIAAGTAALAYQQNSSQEILNAVINATNHVVSPGALASAQGMIRSNYSWITGYRWTQNMFKKWSY